MAESVVKTIIPVVYSSNSPTYIIANGTAVFDVNDLIPNGRIPIGATCFRYLSEVNDVIAGIPYKDINNHWTIRVYNHVNNSINFYPYFVIYCI